MKEPLTDEEFADLTEKLEDAIEELEELQQQYIRETGRRFVQPIRLAPRKRRAA